MWPMRLFVHRSIGLWTDRLFRWTISGRVRDRGGARSIPTSVADDTGSKPGFGFATMKILIADDHALFRAGTKRILHDLVKNAEIVEAGDLDGVIGAIADHGDLQLILLDLAMPGMKGSASVEILSDLTPDALIVVVSSSESRNDVLQAIKCGAVGYIPKTSSQNIMISALNLVLAGGVYLPPELIRENEFPDEEDGAQSRHPSGDGPPAASLTRRQREVFTLLAQGRSNKEIAIVLDLSVSTVKVHVSRVFNVLGVANRTEAALLAGQLGAFPPPESE